MASLWRCAINSTHTTGVRIATVLHYKARAHATTSADASAHQVADQLVTDLAAKYRLLYSNKWTQNDFTVTEVVTPGSGSIPDHWVHGIGTLGSISPSGDSLPIPTAVLVTLYTNAAVRSGHGRSFLPNPELAANLDANGKFDTATAWWTGALASWCAQMPTDSRVNDGLLVDQDLSLVIYSHTRHAAGQPSYYFDVVQATPKVNPHWLRSRMTAP